MLRHMRCDHISYIKALKKHQSQVLSGWLAAPEAGLMNLKECWNQGQTTFDPKHDDRCNLVDVWVSKARTLEELRKSCHIKSYLCLETTSNKLMFVSLNYQSRAVLTLHLSYLHAWGIIICRLLTVKNNACCQRAMKFLHRFHKFAHIQLLYTYVKHSKHLGNSDMLQVQLSIVWKFVVPQIVVGKKISNCLETDGTHYPVLMYHTTFNLPSALFMSTGENIQVMKHTFAIFSLFKAIKLYCSVCQAICWPVTTFPCSMYERHIFLSGGRLYMCM